MPDNVTPYMIPAVPGVELHHDLRTAVRDLCKGFPDSYWRQLDAERAYPDSFVKALTHAGYLAALIPEEYGGSGLGIAEASIILEEINRSGGNAGACHAQMYTMGTLLRHGSARQKQAWLPKIASGELRLQAFGVSEPTTGSDTTQLRTLAVRKGDAYIVRGQKIWISRAEHSDLLLLVVRTTPIEQVKKKTEGMTLFFADIDRNAVEVRELHKCGRPAVDTNMLFIDNLYVALEDRVGEEGKGFSYILDGINPERILVAAEAIGMGKRALDRAVRYAKERVVFHRPIGMNQGIQFPLADSAAKLETAELMVYKAAWLYDQGRPCGKEANVAKYMSAEACFEAADRAMQTHGGYGYIKDYDVERYWRECRLFRIAPISQEMVLNYVGEHVLGLPRSY